ncbi:LacI family DNA-binding transcriptional regulator [Planctomycetota bacterium]|nr:LacI family DNA-binding transcriptional regulator [Planctomycetota bacterium]
MSMMEIAKIAGVSHVTVSRVINDQPGVSEETAAQIRKIIDDMGYKPRADRRRSQLKQYRTNIMEIAVIVTGEACKQHSSFLQKLYYGVERVCESEGVCSSLLYASTPSRLAMYLEAHQYKGVLLVGEGDCGWVVDAVKDIPAVWLTSHSSTSGGVVLSGNEMIGRIAANYLSSRNLKNLAYICADGKNPSYQYRGEMFVYAAKSGGAEVVEFIDDIGNQLTSGAGIEDLSAIESRLEILVEQYAKSSPRPTGIFVPSDLMTAIVYRLLRKHNIKPGIDVEIISVDNEAPYLAGLYPRPATIDIGPISRGERGVEQLLWQIRHPEQDRGVHVVIEPILVKPEQI